MQKIRGISLVVLVIVIMVMIILTGAIVITLNNSGVIHNASEAVDASNKATMKQEQELKNAEKEIAKYTGADSIIAKNVTKNIKYSSIEEAINNSEDNDIIEIAGGEYDLIGEKNLLNISSIIEINKSITIRAADAKDKPILLVTSSDGTTFSKVIEGVAVKADNVRIENIILKVTEGKAGSGNLLKIYPKDNSSTDYYQGITIDGCEFYGSDHSIEMYAKNTNIKDCIFDESMAVDQGNIMVVKGATGVLNITNNIFIGKSQKKHGISFYDGKNSYIQGKISIENNTFKQVYKGIVHESAITYHNVSVEIKNNTFTNYKKKAVAIDKGSFIEYSVIGNIFDIPSDGPVIIDNGTDFMVDANYNYWGTNEPNKSEIFEGIVNATNYYTSADKSNSTSWKN